MKTKKPKAGTNAIQKAEMIRIIQAWQNVSGRDIRASCLAVLLGCTEGHIFELNKKLGGEYRFGWSEQSVGKTVLLAGDWLWRQIQLNRGETPAWAELLVNFDYGK